MTLPAIAIATINRNAPSETFIRAHVTGLPAAVHFMTGGPVPDCVSLGLSGSPTSLEIPEISRSVAIARYLREHRIEALLAEFGPVGAALLPACLEARVPLTVYFYGYDAYRDDVLGEWGHAYPRLFAEAAAIVCISKSMRADLIDRGAPAARVHHNPCGYDPALFGAKGGAGERPPIFLAVGRLVEKKGPLHTIRAFAKVAERSTEATLVLAGAGPLDEACRGLVDDLGLVDRVRLLGVIDHASAARLMGEARVFVQHSLTPPSGDREGTPVAIIEACASGLPVVSTRHGGIPDVVAHGDTGFLVEEGDVDAMADHMLALLRDDGLATRVGRAGHLRVSEDFSLERTNARLWRIVRQTFEAKGSPRDRD